MSLRIGRHPAVTVLAILAACGGDGPTGDTTPPAVVSLAPVAGDAGIARTAAITVTFSERIDPRTANSTSFRLATADETIIAGTLSVSNTVLTFTPLQPLPTGTTFSAHVSTGIRDLAGNALSSPTTWTFSTAINPPPVLISVTPSNGATRVGLRTSISATFSEPVVATTPSSFVLRTIDAVTPGTVSADGSTLTLVTASLGIGTTYTVQLGTSIHDVDGAPLAEPFTWTFTTAVEGPPERISAMIQVGDTVRGELIDGFRDIDDFHVRGEAGAEWLVFAQTTSDGQSSVRLVVYDSLTETLLAEVETLGKTLELERRSTGRFVLPRSGPYIVRVSGNQVASYAFRIAPVNRAPEATSAGYALGDTVTEAIEVVGDVDEFTFHSVAGQDISVSMQPLSVLVGGVTMELVQAGTVIRRIETGSVPDRLDDFGTGRVTLPATSSYTVRFLGPANGPKATTTAAYRFTVYRIDPHPENGALLQLDGPPTTSMIERPGDYDDYEIRGTAGQLVVMRLTRSEPVHGDMAAWLLGADGTRYTAARTGGILDRSAIEYSRRMALPYTGTYRIRVEATHSGGLSVGQYALEAYTVSSAPERVSSTIAIGETVTGERIDRPGDLDVFTFAGERSREVAVFLGTETPRELYARVSSTIHFTRPGTFALDVVSTGRIPVKDSTYTLIIDSHWSSQEHMMDVEGPYAFRVFPIDPRPEGRPTTYVLGDTVSAERLYPAGDIDDYTFELTEATAVEIFWEGASDSPSTAVRGLLYGSTSPDLDVWSSFFPSTGQPTRLTLPAGQYRLTVFNQMGTGHEALPYRFAISRRGTP